MRHDRGQIAMKVSNRLNLDLAATHRLMLINRVPLRERFTSAYREDLLLEPVTNAKPSWSAASDNARSTYSRCGH